MLYITFLLTKFPSNGVTVFLHKIKSTLEAIYGDKKVNPPVWSDCICFEKDYCNFGC